MKPNLLVPGLFVVTLLCAAAGARTIYVDDDAPDLGDGSSWETAYRYLQDALAEAETAEGPVEIRVAQGLYRPDRSSAHPDGTGDCKATFHLADCTTIKGGYAGLAAADPNARDIETYATVLSGDLAANDTWTDSGADAESKVLETHSENSECIVDGSNTGPAAVLDGVQIEGAAASPSTTAAVQPRMGGLYVKSGRPSVSHCLFTKNLAPGVMNGEGADLILTKCRFVRNQTFEGAAVTNVLGNPTITQCVFEDNSAVVGAALANRVGDVIIRDSVFADNAAVQKAGAVLSVGGSLHATGCDFRRNTVTWSSGSAAGGAVYADDGSDVVFDDCTFTHNSSSDAGGAVGVRGGTVTVRRCEFHSNRAGGAGGGIWAISEFEVPIAGSVFVANQAEAGGAVFCLTRGLQSQGCVFAGNRCQERGAAIFFGGPGTVKLDRCSLQGNRAKGGQGSALCGGLASIEIEDSIIWEANAVEVPGFGTLSVAYSNIYDPWNGVGNISGDPAFSHSGYWDPNGTPDYAEDDFWVDGDYHLKSQAGRWDPVTESWVVDEVTSPCIDAGDPNSPIGHEAFPNGGRVNMGAYGGTAEASKSPSGLHATYGGGTGVPNDPYLICTAEHLNALGAEPDDYDKHFRLMADIDLARYWYDRAVIAPDTNDLEPLFQGTPFTGVFDGGGHTISHLNIEGTSLSAVFGQVGEASWLPDGEGGEVRSLGLIEPTVFVTGEGQSAGALVGYLSRGTVIRCCVEGGLIDAPLGNGVGGLVGSNSGTVTGCSANVKVTGTYHVGGLIGRNGGTATACHATVTGTGTNWVGGLAGSNSGALVQCFSLGRVNGGDCVGGLTGWNDGTITDCYTTAAASGSQWVGGLSGVNVQRDLHPDPGAFSTGQVYHSYSAGPVSGHFQVGGLCGSNGGSIIDCFWDVETSGRTRMCGHDDAQEDTGRCDDSFGLTTVDMQTADTFLEAGWDFVGETGNGTDEIWWILEGRDYPRLWWERGDESRL